MPLTSRSWSAAVGRVLLFGRWVCGGGGDEGWQQKEDERLRRTLLCVGGLCVGVGMQWCGGSRPPGEGTPSSVPRVHGHPTVG